MKKLDYKQPKFKTVKYQSSRRFLEVSYGKEGEAGNYDSRNDINYDEDGFVF